jgi:hypothetical protein
MSKKFSKKITPIKFGFILTHNIYFEKMRYLVNLEVWIRDSYINFQTAKEPFKNLFSVKTYEKM